MANHKQELHMEAILLLVVQSTHNMEICAGSPILLSYKATIHCTSKFQRRFLKIEAPRVKICKINQPEKRIAYIWWPCLLTDRDEMSNLYRGHSIDVSYQVLVHFTKRFQRRFKCEKLTDYGRQVITKAHKEFHIVKIWAASGFTKSCFGPLKNFLFLVPVAILDGVQSYWKLFTNVEWVPPMDYSCQLWFIMSLWFQRRRL